MNENFEILKLQVNGFLPKRWGRKPEYPEKAPDNQPENRYHIIIRGENSPPQPGIEPSPCNTDADTSCSSLWIVMCLSVPTHGEVPWTQKLPPPLRTRMGAQGYQRFPLSKPVAGQNIALHATPADRASVPSFCLPGCFAFIFPKLLRPSTVECVIKKYYLFNILFVVAIHFISPWCYPSRFAGRKTSWIYLSLSSRQHKNVIFSVLLPFALI